MKIHSDILTRENLLEHVPDGVTLELAEKGSRKRRHAFDVEMAAEPGEDAHGVPRRYSRMSGGPDRAATWVEWGDWMVELFKLDENAVIGDYDGREDFVRRTYDTAPHRPEDEDAEAHQRRWSEDLFYHFDKPSTDVRS